MKHMTTVDVPATTRTFVHHRTCDLCGYKISTKPYEVNEVTMAHRTGKQYPECGSGKHVEFDICGQCFTDVLIPQMKSLGATPTTTEWDI